MKKFILLILLSSIWFVLFADTVANPTFNPVGGTFNVPTTVQISTTTVGATIRYTLDGTNPTVNSPRYTIPLEINLTTTVNAKAFKTGWTSSQIVTQTYIITNTVDAPSFTPLPGVYASPQEVTLSTTTPSADIYYTIDGSDPDQTSYLYTGPLMVDASMTIKAVAYVTGQNPSQISEGNYIIVIGSITNASISPNPFSPDGDGQKDETNITFYVSEQCNIVFTVMSDDGMNTYFTHTIYNCYPGWNNYVYDGSGLTTDGKYKVVLNIDGTGIIYEFASGLLRDTTPPEINIISSYPNPFSPNAPEGDGYNDIHRTNFNVDGIYTELVGTIDVWLDSVNADFMNGGPDLSVFNHFTDGAYLFLKRSGSTASANTQYSITLSNLTSVATVAVNRGLSLYKLGDYPTPYYSISPYVGIIIPPDEDGNPQFFTGHDYIELWAMEGNASFNMYNNDGTAFDLNSLYPMYFGNGSTQVKIGSPNYEEALPGVGMEDGRYIYRVIVTDGVGHESVESGELLVNNNPIQITGQSQINTISPANQDGQFDVAIIQYTVTEPSYITIKILDVLNNVVRVLQTAELNTTGGGYVIWDGKDTAGNFVSASSQADYFVEITAQDRFILEDMVSKHITLVVDNQVPIPPTLNPVVSDSIRVKDITISGITSEIDCNIIVKRVCNNVTTTFAPGNTPLYPGYFEFPVTLLDGLNSTYVQLKDNVGNLGTASNIIQIMVDTQAPEVASIVSPQSGEVFTTVNVPLKAVVTDFNGSGVANVSFNIFNGSKLLIPPIAATYNTAQNFWQADLVVPNNLPSMNLKLTLTAEDYMGNVSIDSTSVYFIYAKPGQTPKPTFVTSYPDSNSSISSITTDKVYVVIFDLKGILFNPVHSNIQLITPGNEIISHNQGATLEYTTLVDSTYKIGLALNNPLSTNGTDDGSYWLKYTATNTYYETITDSVLFKYDTTAPDTANFRVNTTQQMQLINEQYYYSQTINSLQFDLIDPVAGIDFAPNVTTFTLYNSSNQIISGQRAVIGNTLRFNLNTPLAANPQNSGLYRMLLRIEDQAGNIKAIEKTFNLITIQVPEIISQYPVNQSQINVLTNNQIGLVVLDRNGLGFDEELSSVVLQGAGTTYQNGMNAYLTFTEIPLPGMYNITLNLLYPLAVDGSDDGIYTVTVNLRDKLAQAVNSQITFKYDSIAPSVNNVWINNGSQLISILADSTLTTDISFVEVAMTDTLSHINFNSVKTKAALYKMDGTLIGGLKSIVNSNIRWTLNTLLTNTAENYGSYYITISAADSAGNIFNGRKYFTLNNQYAPSVVSMVPGNNTTIKVLTGNEVRVRVQNPTGSGTINPGNFLKNYLKLTSPLGTVYQHTQGAQQTITDLGSGIYDFVLTLDYAIPADGSEDGVYVLQIGSENSSGYSINNEYSFSFDTTAPQIDAKYLSYGDLLLEFNDGDILYNSVTGASVKFMDATSNLNWATTTVGIYHNSNLLPGVTTIYANQNKMIYTLNDTLNTEGTYYLAINAVDTAGNTLNRNIAFNINSFSGEFSTLLPGSNANVNTPVGSINLVLNYSGTEGINSSLSYVKLYHPDGDSVYHNHGAIQTLTNTGNQYSLTLQLNQPFSANGDDDGQYTVKALLKSNSGLNIPVNYQFVYDTQKPYYATLRMNNNDQLDYINDRSNAIMNKIRKAAKRTAGVNYYFTGTQINSIKTAYKELYRTPSTVVSGVDFSPLATKLYITNANNEIVQGNRTYDNGETITWTLSQPITVNGIYHIVFTATDKAGNLYTENLTFEKVTVSTPQIVNTYPIASTYLNSLSNNQVYLTVNDVNGLGLNSTLTNLLLTGPNNTYSNNANAAISIQGLAQTNYYQVGLTLNTQLDNNGADDGTYALNGVITDNLDQVTAHNFSFIYDTTTPVADTVFINNGTVTTVLASDQVTGNIRYVEVSFHDQLAGLNLTSTLSKVNLFKADGTLIPGAKVIIGNRIRWYLTALLDNIPVNYGNYYIAYQAMDNAGNELISRRDFSFTNANAPELVTIAPVNHAIIASLNPAEVTATIKSLSGTIDITNLFDNQMKLISPQGVTYANGQGAVLTLTDLGNNDYSFKLTLSYPLIQDGTQDGTYTVLLNTVNSGAYTLSSTTDFVYDTQLPLINTVKVGTTANMISLQDNDVVYNTINKIKVVVSDQTSGIQWNQSEIILRDMNQQIVPGELIITPSQQLLTFNLQNSLIINSSYTLTVKIKDMAGDSLATDYNFTTASFNGSIVTTQPLNGAFVKDAISQVGVAFTYTGSGSISNTLSWMKMYHPDGDSIYGGHGAIFGIEASGNQYNMGLQLNTALSAFGDDDGLYTVKLNIVTDNGNVIPYTFHFVYDTRIPYYDNLKFNDLDSLLVVGSRLMQTKNMKARTREDEYYFSDPITKISCNFRDSFTSTTDVVSGIDFAPNITKLYIQNSAGSLIDGYRVWNGTDKVDWVLNQPITQPGSYIIKVQAKDNAGNLLEKTITFQLIYPQYPQIVSHIPANASYVNNLLQNRVSVIVNDFNGLGLDQLNTDMLVTGGGNNYSNYNNADLQITSVGTNQYSVSLYFNQTLNNSPYTVVTRVIDRLGMQVSDTTYFSYDTIEPVIAHLFIQDTNNQTTVIDTISIFTTGIQSVEGSFNDILSHVDLISPLSKIQLYQSNGTLVPGNKVLDPANNKIRWVLTNALLNTPANYGAYYIDYTIVDSAGNILHSIKDFTLTDENSPVVQSIVPANNSILSSLTDDNIDLFFTNPNGTINLNDHQNNYLKLISPTAGSYYQGHNATQTITALGNETYRIRLHLTHPLPADGSEDGNYLVQVKISNSSGYSLLTDSNFNYDSQSPNVAYCLAGLPNSLQNIQNNAILYQPVTLVKVKLNELTSSINWDTATVGVYGENNTLIPGQQITYPNQDLMTWGLNDSLANYANYTVRINATDLAGNNLQEIINFSTNSFTGEFLTQTPVNASFINTPVEAVSLTFSYNGIDAIDPLTTRIYLVHPDTDSIYHEHGGTQFLTQNINNYELKLNLIIPLSQNGEDDGNYQVYAQIRTTTGLVIPYNFHFVYDTTHPYYTNILFNGTDSLLAISDRYRAKNKTRVTDRISNFYDNDISSLKVTFKDSYVNTNDIVSGIDFAPNISRLYLTSESGEIINGVRNWNGETVEWVLNETLTANATYKIMLQTADNAGNGLSYEIPFMKIQTSQPQIVSHIPAEGAYLNLLADDKISVTVQDNNALGLDLTNTSVVLNGGGLSYYNNQNAQLDVVPLGLNFYRLDWKLSNSSPDSLNDDKYQVITTVTDRLGISSQDTVSFVYDTQRPIGSNQLVGFAGSYSLPLVNNSVINDSLNFTSVRISDLLSGVDLTSSTNVIGIYNYQGVLLDGSQAVVGDTLKYVLTQYLHNDGTDDGAYYVQYRVTDRSGNSLGRKLNFNLINSNAPQLVSLTPQTGTTLQNLTPNEIVLQIHDSHQLDTNALNTWINVITPLNTVITDGSSGVMSIVNNGNGNWTVKLTILQDLTTNGAYAINYRVANTSGYFYSSQAVFMIDNQAPVVNNVILGLAHNNPSILHDNDIIYDAVTYIEANIADNSGLLFPADSTYIRLMDSGGNEIPGTMTYSSTTQKLKIQLTTPLNVIGQYYTVTLKATDPVGNVVSHELNFRMNAFNGNVLAIYPPNNAAMNISFTELYFKIRLFGNSSINQDESYIRLIHPDGSIIGDPNSNSNGYGAVQEITVADSIYQIKLRLNQALDAEGADDGEYMLSVNLLTSLNEQIPLISYFKYDRLIPSYSNLMINASTVGNALMKKQAELIRKFNKKLIQNNREIFTSRIDSVSVDFADLTTGVNFISSQTVVQLLDPRNNILSSTKTTHGNRVACLLTNPVLADGENDGTYKIKMKAIDYAGNVLNAVYEFQLISNIIPDLISYTPAYLPAYTNSLSPAAFSATFKDYFGLVNNPSMSYIRLVHPNGDVSSHPYGGDQTITGSDNNAVINFTLDGDLSTNGEDDGIYSVLIRATNTIQAQFDTTLVMIYDTVKPKADSIWVIGANQKMIAISDSSEVSEDIYGVRVRYSDLTAGLYYIPNITKVSLMNRYNEVIPGMLSYTSDFDVIWTLDAPIPAATFYDGTYYVNLTAGDKAGNGLLKNVPFTLFTLNGPVNLSFTFDAVYNAHLTWQHYTPQGLIKGNRARRVIEHERGLINYNIYRQVDNQAWVFAGTSSNTHFSESLKNEPDGVYKYKVIAIYTAGLSPEVLSDTLRMFRFVPVDITVTLSDNLTPDAVHLQMQGDDGIYNMIFDNNSDDTGIFHLTHVFMDYYHVLLEKDGYNTLDTTILVTNTNKTFHFVLQRDVTLAYVIPEINVLYQNYPNPFNPTTIIKYGIKEDSKVELTIYNIKGQKVKNLVNGNQKAGYHGIKWNGKDETGKDAASGIYMYILKVNGNTDKYVSKNKMLLLK